MVENRGFTAIGGTGRSLDSLALILSVSAMYRCIFGTVQLSNCHLTLGITEIRCETSEKRSGHGAALFGTRIDRRVVLWLWRSDLDAVKLVLDLTSAYNKTVLLHGACFSLNTIRSRPFTYTTKAPPGSTCR